MGVSMYLSASIVCGWYLGAKPGGILPMAWPAEIARSIEINNDMRVHRKALAVVENERLFPMAGAYRKAGYRACRGRALQAAREAAMSVRNRERRRISARV